MNQSLLPIVAIVLGLLFVLTEAIPLSHDAALTKAMRAPTPLNTTRANSFHASGLDYMTWAQKMVDEGVMYWAPTNTNNNTSTSVAIPGTKATWSLKNIACGFLIGTKDEYDTGKDRLCRLIEDQAGATLLSGEVIVSNGVCEDNEDCTLAVAVAFNVAGGLVRDALPAVCDAVYEDLWSSCNGAIGGTGELEVTGSKGKATGTVSAQFYADDPGATCPADDSTQVCEVSTF
ncbi:uncharacterized protein BDV14DRAFT_200668 [Aspergillus stella-maris]|uniref:uncharacterized protein n=1 Tax=Aspergillus stella-maris TaxID=1810926 RepID=UPI003CCD2D2A